MFVRCPRCHHCHHQLITFTRATAEAKPHTPAGEDTRKERTMLNATHGMLAMLPVVFGVAGYVMVFR
jgi:hypothetical protein